MENILGKKGITSSEANHITNVTKELVKDLSITSLPISTSVVATNEGDLPLDENTANENWVENILKTGELFALSAWLKTAIKYKEQLLDDASNESFEYNGSVEDPELERTPSTPRLLFTDYLNQLNTQDRTTYLTNESVAAHIGKFVHTFDELRQKSEAFVPTSFMRLGSSGETATVKSTRLYTKDQLSDGFYKLQKEHRAAEQVVNLYKSRHKDWMQESMMEYHDKVRAIQSRNTNKQLEYNRKVEALRLDFEDSRNEKKKEISVLKIVIPHDLQETLEYVNHFAKR